jgi:superfamily II DNA or RNA helicase
MAKLEELIRGSTVKGILPDQLVTVVDVKWIGNTAVDLTYKDAAGRPANELLYRHSESTIQIVAEGSPWSFDGDGGLFRLVSEAQRIRLAYLFDPLLAVHTSMVDPLPHQITAVYGEMLPRQPLRYLLADDPGAGKTIMTGLLVKEEIARGDLQRCMIVCPGNLAEQWQDELDRRFHLSFEIMTNDKLESARTGNWFQENPLVICRLDKLSRDETLHAKLEQSDWDLIVCDEAHKMSASFFSCEVKPTKRYKLGQLLSTRTRNFLLLTATPHNGKEEDFQLFLALLDGDRFEGKFRDGTHTVDTSDLMRRLVKEQLLKFDGRPLFPERRAYTVNYDLSDAETQLYERVTEYVREEFNRAEALENEGRKGTVGFALTVLQRRLASSPEAIYQSLRRRKERLEKRLREEEILRRGAEARLAPNAGLPVYTLDDLDDLDDAPEAEVEEAEEQVVDQASAARTIKELQIEIGMLKELEELAYRVRQSGADRKWDELSRLLQNNSEMFDTEGHRRKLVVFSEHRDTLNYLHERTSGLLGRPQAIVTIHGGMGREERRKAQNAFTQDKEVEILIATDAASEGINLQRAHLMVNYDLPWNPNRLEQRFGRIHRIGQTEVCHLWNLVAKCTREGEVYLRLLEKLDQERQALGGQVFDILGQLTFDNRPLRELLLEAVRYGDSPEVRARLYQIVEQAFDHDQIRKLIEERALTADTMDASKVRTIREDMERAEARRLQPHFIATFFSEAFKRLGGKTHDREPKRFEITNVPAIIRNRDRAIGHGSPVMIRYERITFEKDLIALPGKALADFVCPGHPLLDATIDLTLERNRDLLRRGAVLIDDTDPGDAPRVLVFLEHSIQDARKAADGQRRIVSKQMQFVEIDTAGNTRAAGYAPYLDYRPLTEDELPLLPQIPEPAWLRSELENKVLEYAIQQLVPSHFDELRRRKEELVDKTTAAVKDRLTQEIRYWDHRAIELKEQELAGRVNARLNSGLARLRADDLAARLQKRMGELEQERKLSPLPPVVTGAALIVPAGLLAILTRSASEGSLPSPFGRGAGGEGIPATYAADTKASELRAVAAVMDAERRLGFLPKDVSDEKRGYDLESSIPCTGRLRFIEVKGRAAGAKTVTVTKNEILTALNKPDEFILAIVEHDGDASKVYYVRNPFQREPDFGVTSCNYAIEELLQHATEPC